MRVLFALNHPAHYYLFKYIALELSSKGHEIIYVIKEKDILEQLMKAEKVSYNKISKKKKVKSVFSIVFKGGIELISRDIKLLTFCKKNKPSLLVGTDIAITHVGKLLNIPSFVYNEDDFEINRFFCKLSYQFASYIVSPAYTSVGSYKEKKISYNGIQKMSYLNPKYFTPDKGVLKSLGLSENDKFFIIRLVSLTSGHDIEGNHKGLNENLLRKVIAKLEKEGKVFITSESSLSKEFLKYKISIFPNKMHDLMYYASLFIGDSQSMCAEAGILGTPFIRYNDFVGKIEYLNDLEKNYGLGWGITTDNPKGVFSVIDQLFSIENYKQEWKKKSEKLFKDKVDLTSLSVWLIDNFPNSIKILKENPNYINKF